MNRNPGDALAFYSCGFDEQWLRCSAMVMFPLDDRDGGGRGGSPPRPDCAKYASLRLLQKSVLQRRKSRL